MNTISIRQTIYDLCEIAENSRVPILIVSNPGYAKTTCIQSYAKEKDYYLETLIGSRYEANDISGYQVNEPGEKNLKHKEPTWFTRLWEAHDNGKKSLLFIDELSTCFTGVQGTLLTLIFDRTIGENKFLPEDTTIISAANYADNLNEEADIVSPTLNRFCIFNLLEEKNTNDILDEFLSNDYLEAETHNLKEISFDNFDEDFRKAIKNLFEKHNSSSSLGFLNLKNTNFQNLYRMNEDVILNMISGRSLTFLKKVLKSAMSFGILDKSVINGFVDGLIGAGTCSFNDNEQLFNYRKETKNICYNLCVNYLNKSKEKVTVKLNDKLNESMIEYCSLSNDKDSSLDYILEYENELTKKIVSKYENTVDVCLDIKSKNISTIDFIGFFDQLSLVLNNLRVQSNRSKLSSIHQSLMWIYNEITNTNLNFKDYEKQYGSLPKMCHSCLIAELSDKNGNTEISKVAKYGNTYIKMEDTDSPSEVNLGKIISGAYIIKKFNFI